MEAVCDVCSKGIYSLAIYLSERENSRKFLGGTPEQRFPNTVEERKISTSIWHFIFFLSRNSLIIRSAYTIFSGLLLNFTQDVQNDMVRQIF